MTTSQLQNPLILSFYKKDNEELPEDIIGWKLVLGKLAFCGVHVESKRSYFFNLKYDKDEIFNKSKGKTDKQTKTQYFL